MYDLLYMQLFFKKVGNLKKDSCTSCANLMYYRYVASVVLSLIEAVLGRIDVIVCFTKNKKKDIFSIERCHWLIASEEGKIKP